MTSPQHLPVTILGDYWKGRTDHIPSAGLVRILGGFPIGAIAADLPAELQPRAWARGAAREVFLELYDGRAATAEQRSAELMAPSEEGA